MLLKEQLHSYRITYTSFCVPVYYLFMQSIYTDLYCSQTVLQRFYALVCQYSIHTHTVSLLSCPRTLQLSLDISVNAGFLL